MIYLDNAATTLIKPRCVYRTVRSAVKRYAANPGRSGHREAYRTMEAVYDVRVAIADMFNAPGPENVVFTYNATYALNIAIKSMIYEPCHVIISDMEHNSVLRPLAKLCNTLGIEYSTFNSSVDDLEIEIDRLVRLDTKFIVTTLRSNVTGRDINQNALKKIKKKHGLGLIIDASQAAGHVGIDFTEMGCDALACPGHKGLFGITGSGFVIFKDSKIKNSVIEGGSGNESINVGMPIMLPEAYEAGTLGVCGILSVGTGIEYINGTGLDYIKRLGITHIQLLPIYDYGSVDEECPVEQYNWGYDPVNYNIPEGSYSSDPARGEVRIKELKQAIQSLHQNGFRVIMDVVYNHTYALDSWLWRTVPWYYNRQNDDGTASNGSGCGNELATERSMCAKYILDSVLYWAEEYHIDGFRFDLMGLLDVDLMNNIQSVLDARFGPGEKLIYGEPWSAASSAVRPGTILSNKDHLKSLSPSIGAFCDNTRDAVKGSLMNEMAAGFVNGGGISADYLAHCISGWSLGDEAQVLAPSQTITYLSCHDDWTLWDKLVFTLLPERDFRRISPEVLRRNRLATSMNFCCQGRPFLLAGEEFGRTKGGIKNSYKSAPYINQLDWNRAWENSTLVEHYRGLIHLRQQLPCLCDKTPQASKRILAASEPHSDCVLISMDNTGSQSKWNRIIMIFNVGVNPLKVNLPLGTWQVLADDVTSFRWQEHMTVEGSTTVPGVSALILGCEEVN